MDILAVHLGRKGLRFLGKGALVGRANSLAASLIFLQAITICSIVGTPLGVEHGTAPRSQDV